MPAVWLLIAITVSNDVRVYPCISSYWYGIFKYLIDGEFIPASKIISNVKNVYKILILRQFFPVPVTPTFNINGLDTFTCPSYLQRITQDHPRCH